MFSSRLLKWYDQHGRHKLPWQTDKTLYRVWVSEIMLQQTQVATVIPYYQRFMQRFPTIQNLAEATQDDVLAHWAGLGYYARARNLHAAAQHIINQHAGKFPDEPIKLNALPGIGRSTASAILALALNQRHVILDGNAKRSLCRYCGVEGFPGERKTEDRLWQLADFYTPKQRAADYTQAIMDMGAILCTRSKPDCIACPHSEDCVAYQTNRVTRLPSPKPKKTKPHKSCYMLVMINQQNNVLLFKRPSKGIWGGLYSFPEVSSKQSLQKCINKTACKTTIGEDIKHVFTHFSLDITPVFARCSTRGILHIRRVLAANKNSGVLLNESAQTHLTSDAESFDVGLPAPVLKILRRAPQLMPSMGRTSVEKRL